MLHLNYFLLDYAYSAALWCFLLLCPRSPGSFGEKAVVWFRARLSIQDSPSLKQKSKVAAQEGLNEAAKAASVLDCMEGNRRQSPGKRGHYPFE